VTLSLNENRRDLRRFPQGGVVPAMLVAHPTAAQDHRFEADPVASVRDTKKVLSK
jgi:hypothetical protein